MWPHHVTFIHLSVGGHQGLHLLSLMNNAATNIPAQVFMWTYVFVSFGYIPRSGIFSFLLVVYLGVELPGCLMTLCLTFCVKLPDFVFPKWLHPFVVSPAV